MQTKLANEDVVHQVWSRAVGNIVKGKAPAPLRARLGDQIDMIIPQVAAAGLMSANPGFAKVLYAASYSSAKQNAWIVTRQLGMPPDFFWKFEYWTQERAFETMQKIIARVFAAIMAHHKEGVLELVAADVEHMRFEVTFQECVECSGLATSDTICFFHAGLFTGILGSLLDKDLDAVELECVAQGSKSCRFKIGSPADQEIEKPLEEKLDRLSLQMDYSNRMEASLKQDAIRSVGNLVDVGYYQLMLSSVFLTNMDVMSDAFLATGEKMGQALAPQMSRMFPGDAASAISGFYTLLRYTDVRVKENEQGVEVQVEEAPEMIGPLAQAMPVPFLCGGLQSLLSALLHKPLHFQTAQRDGNTLRLFFGP